MQRTLSHHQESCWVGLQNGNSQSPVGLLSLILMCSTSIFAFWWINNFQAIGQKNEEMRKINFHQNKIAGFELAGRTNLAKVKQLLKIEPFAQCLSHIFCNNEKVCTLLLWQRACSQYCFTTSPCGVWTPFYPFASSRNQIIVSQSNHLRLQNHVIPSAALMVLQ